MSEQTDSGPSTVMSFLDVLTCGLGGAILLFLCFAVVKGQPPSRPLAIGEPAYVKLRYLRTDISDLGLQFLKVDATLTVEEAIDEIEGRLRSGEITSPASRCDFDDGGRLQSLDHPEPETAIYALGLPYVRDSPGCSGDVRPIIDLCLLADGNVCPSMRETLVVLPQIAPENAWYVLVRYERGAIAGRRGVDVSVEWSSSDDAGVGGPWVVAFGAAEAEPVGAATVPLSRGERLLVGPLRPFH